MVSICKTRQSRLLKNVNKHFRNFIGQNQQKTKMEWKAQKSTYPFNKATACILVKIVTRVRCKVHVLYHGMGRANTTCWITYFWLWRYWLAIQLRNTVSNRSMTSSSHVFTNPESTVYQSFSQNFLCLVFYRLEVFKKEKNANITANFFAIRKVVIEGMACPLPSS